MDHSKSWLSNLQYTYNFSEMPEAFFKALKTHLPALIETATGIKKTILTLSPKSNVIDMGYSRGFKASVWYGGDELWLLSILWLDNNTYQFQIEVLLPALQNKHHTWFREFLEKAVISNLYEREFLEQATTELTNQLEKLTGIDLAGPDTFFTLVNSVEPVFHANGFALNSFDLIGMDNFATPLNFIWYPKPDSQPPYSLADLEPLLPSRLVFFAWNNLPANELREQYVSSLPTPHPDTSNLSISVEWSKWWSHSLPDLSIYIYTDHTLTTQELNKFNDIFWQTLTNITKNAAKSIMPTYDPDTLQAFYQKISQESRSYEETQSEEKFKELWSQYTKIVSSSPIQNEALSQTNIEAAAQGFANYFGGISERSDKQYFLHVDFLKEYIIDEVIMCWILALEQVSKQIGISRIRIG